jgi:hypothetical protein
VNSSYFSVRNLVAVIFDDLSGNRERQLRAAVKADKVEADPTDLGGLTDWSRLAKAHKEKNMENERKMLTSLLISRTAAKDFVL